MPHGVRSQPDGLSPRVRGNLCIRGWGGGTSVSEVGASYPPGLSPRVRGNPAAADSPLYDVRSIPACAGEPTSLACK